MSLLPKAGAWNYDGHHLVNEVALDILPEGPLKDLLETDRTSVVRSGSEPDLIFRHQFPEVEGERHYYELDEVGPPPYEGLPLTWEALDACRLPPPEKVGRLPLSVREHYDELVSALAREDAASARRAAGLLGHYVADATMPLHATSNFDGWRTGNRGIHFLLEVTLYQRARKDIQRRVRKLAMGADAVGSPEETTVTLLKEAMARVAPLLQIDTKAIEAGGRLDGRNAKALKEAVPIVAECLARAARALAGLWERAFEESQRPPE